MRMLLTAATLALATFAASAAPTDFPSRPVTLVVPFPPGGAVDIVGRFVAEKLSKTWGQPVVIENVAGAGTSIGSAQVSKAAADGYTILINSATFTMNSAVQTSLPFDPVEDFTAIGMVGKVPLVLAVGSAIKVTDIEGLKEVAKSRPLKYATVGLGSINQFAAEMLQQASGIDLEPVHYKGGAPAMTDVIGGHADLFYGSLTQVLPQIRGGLMTGILVSSAERSAAMPELPSVVELGMTDAVVDQWWGLFGPKGMDAAVVEKINADLTAVVKSQEMKEFLSKDGGDPAWATAEEFGSLVAKEMARWREIAAANNIKAE
ncbi:Bug family tripartite tricarboxylate transporter substrate binding protein [Arvimicrobium flavum]|uniref:Bug family tripartite tricarboxylate transporter substrate binding protein n=1 Tax=Arvimicrobium flavum TaxID=3393320 RepID=UPI00237C346D|nr:tripartite tricarboxylate transporter substrate binding protein [Mesorhizobium shangrilense]